MTQQDHDNKQKTLLKCSSKEKFDHFKQVNHISNANIKVSNELNSPLEVKLINCAEIQHKLRSPILSKTEEKKVSQDISSMDTNHS